MSALDMMSVLELRPRFITVPRDRAGHRGDKHVRFRMKMRCVGAARKERADHG